MQFVDSHCHLDFPEFAADPGAVIERARRAGVGHMLSICTHITRFEQVLKLASAHDGVFCTAGIHPHEAGRENTTVEELLSLAYSSPKVVGFGESGLDYYYQHSPKEDQIASFKVHIEAARKAGLPLVIHSRDADEDMGQILKEEMERGTFKGVVHCFTSGRVLAELAIELGLYISVSGVITFKNAAPLLDIVRDIPLNRLLVETDAPFLAPVPKRGKTNEPAFVVHTASALAAVKKLGLEEIAEVTSNNFFNLFSKAR